jgi:HSP20 family protein
MEIPMADTASKTPVKAGAPQRPLAPWRPFGSLSTEIDRLFEELDGGFVRAPGAFATALMNAAAFPAIDFVETDKAFELTADVPGMAEKDIRLEVINGVLRITGETKDEKEEKRRDYYMSERRHGSFERRVRIPDGVDADKIEATFKNGLLAVTLPKTAEAQAPAKQIPVKGA